MSKDVTHLFLVKLVIFLSHPRQYLS